MSHRYTQVIGFLSPKGGTGKTLILTHALRLLNDLGASILVIDADVGTFGASVLLSQDQLKSAASNRAGYSLVDAFLEFDRSEQLTLVPLRDVHQNNTKFDLIIPYCVNARHPTFEFALTDEIEKFQTFFERTIKQLRDSKSYDYIFIDTRGGYDGICTSVSNVCDTILFITDSGRTPIDQAGLILRLLSKGLGNRQPDIHIIANRLGRDQVSERMTKALQRISQDADLHRAVPHTLRFHDDAISANELGTISNSSVFNTRFEGDLIPLLHEILDPESNWTDEFILGPKARKRFSENVKHQRRRRQRGTWLFGFFEQFYWINFGLLFCLAGLLVIRSFFGSDSLPITWITYGFEWLWLVFPTAITLAAVLFAAHRAKLRDTTGSRLKRMAPFGVSIVLCALLLIIPGSELTNGYFLLHPKRLASEASLESQLVDARLDIQAALARYFELAHWNRALLNEIDDTEAALDAAQIGNSSPHSLSSQARSVVNELQGKRQAVSDCSDAYEKLGLDLQNQLLLGATQLINTYEIWEAKQQELAACRTNLAGQEDLTRARMDLWETLRLELVSALRDKNTDPGYRITSRDLLHKARRYIEAVTGQDLDYDRYEIT